MKSIKLIQLRFLLFLPLFSCEEFNLFGGPGQAYSIEIYIGKPKQKLNVIVDTGSSTLAIASYSFHNNETYFHADNSTSLIDSGKEVHATYSQGTWNGRLVSDFIEFPSLPKVPQVRSDFAIIKNSHKFFKNGSGWQGLLGLAYLPVGAWAENVVVGSWLDSVDCNLDRPASFELQLCGPQGLNNSTHSGKFSMIVDDATLDGNPEFRTPILHKRWYEVGVIGINVRNMDSPPTNSTEKTKASNFFLANPPQTDVCLQLNAEKSIVDSGTTTIRLPDELFRQVVGSIQKQAQSSNLLILDEFWYHWEAACWPQPQMWTLPWLEIYLLNADSDHSYFVLQIPPQNYMRVVSARNDSGTVAQYCYKLGLSAGGKETVLGYTAMEGFKVLFNRTASWIGWSKSDCGSNVLLDGPFYVKSSLVSDCELTKSDLEVSVSIKAAQWALLAVSIIATVVLCYVVAPCQRIVFFMRRRSLYMSRAALVEQELN